MADLPIDWEHATRGSSALEVFLLGLVELESALVLQNRMIDQISQRDDRQGALLICEHPPAITIGREGSFADVLVEREELIARQTEIRWLSRGGGAISHAPGQIAVYIQVPFHRLKWGLTTFRQRLQQSLVSMAADLDVEATSVTTVPGAACRCGQFAFIGAGVRDGVTHGGMYVNVAVPHAGLQLVDSAHGTRVTSLATQRTRPTSMATARECLIRHLSAALGYESYHLFTGHPLLRRSTRKVYVYA